MLNPFWRGSRYALALVLAGLPPALYSQAVPSSSPAGNQVTALLPNAPEARDGASAAQLNGETETNRVAPEYSNTIEAGYQAQKLDTRHKVIFAAAQLGSVHFFGGALIAAGFSHGIDGNPKYGTNSEAFGQRVGAAAARGASQIILSGVILAPILHDDTRYYVLGTGHPLSTRALYAVTRVAITRTDSGHQTLNIPELVGYAGSAGLTQLYYPARSRDLQTVSQGYATSLLGLALQNEVAEFVRFLVHGQPR